MNTQEQRRILVAVTGASGMIYLQSFLKTIKNCSVEVHGICSAAGEQVLGLEQEMAKEALPTVSCWFDHKDFTAPPASGSAGYDSMVVLPCSMGSLAAIAGGISANLVHRAADVILKESKRLVLVVRETPLNRNHLRNMLAVHDAGAVICPPFPSYYLRPDNLEEAARTFSWRLCDQLDIQVDDRRRWGDES